jgi:UDP-galactopyranose mutase
LDNRRILVIGAGLSGATAARVLAERGYAVTVAEKAGHPGGHCHSYRDAETGVMVHAHGPHILHSDNPQVWAFLERFARLRPYRHTVRAVTGGRTYPLPITLATLRQFFGRAFTPAEAQVHLASVARAYPHAPANFEEQGRALLGDALYEAFFDGYTRKQWGVEPRRLPASIMRRIPVRFSDDLSYYRHSRVAIPEQGYTAMITAMLDHPAIAASYGVLADRTLAAEFRHTVYTGPIDAWMGHRWGRLGYRTLDFEVHRSSGTFQDVAQVNYCDLSVPWTRIVEHKHFTPWERHAATVYVRETSRSCGEGDIPYYPLRLAGDEPLVDCYRAHARTSAGVSFIGRLATYRYLDMDVAVAEALAAARIIADALATGRPPPSLFEDSTPPEPTRRQGSPRLVHPVDGREIRPVHNAEQRGALAPTMHCGRRKGGPDHHGKRRSQR